jgi:hypothetical protein
LAADFVAASRVTNEGGIRYTSVANDKGKYRIPSDSERRVKCLIVEGFDF